MAKGKGPTPRKVELPQQRDAPKRKWFLVTLLALTGAVVVAAALALTRGGNDGDGSATRDLLVPSDPGPVHVHGLGINPADGALFIATHTGTYRVPSDAQQAARVGDGRQDTMGFTVVGPNRFLGSGHPDPQAMREQKLPPNLGLIESKDGGRTWTPISLLGQADFHVLRSRGRRVYGFDSTNGRLLVSRDGGRTWSQRPIPGPLIDLAFHPRRPSQVVAATERGLIASTEAGRSWRALGGNVGSARLAQPRSPPSGRRNGASSRQPRLRQAMARRRRHRRTARGVCRPDCGRAIRRPSRWNSEAICRRRQVVEVRSTP